MTLSLHAFPSSSCEYKTQLRGCRPSDQANQLRQRVPDGCYRLHPPLHLFLQPESHFMCVVNSTRLRI